MKLKQMLVFHEKNLVILATPKTGTTALYGDVARYASIAFRHPPNLKHTNIKRFERILAPTFSKLGNLGELETFALIREPISWLGSWYRYRHRDYLVGHRNSTRDISFTTFIASWLEKEPLPYARVGSQANFLTDKDDITGVDHLFRYEAPEKYLKFLSNRLGRDIEPVKKNVSPSMSLSLDPDVKLRLLRECARDFEIWESASH